MAQKEFRKVAILAGATLLAMAAGSAGTLACCKAQFERVKPHMSYPLPYRGGSSAQAPAQDAPAGMTLTTAAAQTPNKGKSAGTAQGGGN